MSAPSPSALVIVRSAIARHCYEVDADSVVPEAVLSELGVDSLSLAEMVFEVEDALGKPIADLTQRPQTVADLMRLVEPYRAELANKVSFD